MDDINRKLEDILNDPESMNKVRMMAESLLGDDGEGQKESASNDEENRQSFINSADIGRIMNVIGAYESKGNDNRAKLLLALKPHLSQKRQEKVDSAIKLLKLIEILPLLKDAGILNFG